MPADNSLRYRYQQAATAGAALRGELGVERQIVAMAALYHELRAAGKLAEAAAVKAEAYAIHSAAQAAAEEAAIASVLDEIVKIIEVEHTTADDRPAWRRRLNAAKKAQLRFAAGARLTLAPGGYVAPSASTPGSCYRLIKVGTAWQCTCQAMGFCWHKALAGAYELVCGACRQNLRRAA